MAQCTAWCDAGNKKAASRQICYARCDTYWAKKRVERLDGAALVDWVASG